MFGAGAGGDWGDAAANKYAWDNHFNDIPDDPTYNNPYTESGSAKYGFGDVAKQLNNRLNKIGPLDRTALNKFQDFATSDGPSTWADLQQQMNQEKTMGAYDNAARSSNAGAAQARSAMAGHGGLRSGAMERIARGSASDLLASKQNIGRDDRIASLGISSQDESNKLNALAQLPGMQVQAMQPALQKADMWSRMRVADRDFRGKAMQGQNEFNQFIYGEKMKGSAAARAATAEENSGK